VGVRHGGRKPVLHARDHEHGGADPQRIHYESVGGAGGAGTAVFAHTGDTFGPLTSSPAVLSGTHFYSSDPATFDSSSGITQIVRPGMYVIGCQLTIQPPSNFTAGNWVQLNLKYFKHSGGETGYSIETPYFVHDEQVLGTTYEYPAGTGYGQEIGLQRLHPISLTSSSFSGGPLEIRPTLVWYDDVSMTPWLLAVWGWRLGEPLDSYHSD
jgi:hypothetical protein